MHLLISVKTVSPMNVVNTTLIGLTLSYAMKLRTFQKAPIFMN